MKNAGNLAIGTMCGLTEDYMLINTDNHVCNELIPSIAKTEEELVAQFEFHSSWEWIMYALQFIKEQDPDTIEGKGYKKDAIDAILTGNKTKAFVGLTDFANWFNEHEGCNE